jgi:glycolate oxidase FAD binding subunit
VLGRFGVVQLVEGEGDWAKVRDGAAFAGREGAVWRVSVKPTEGARLAAAVAPAEVAFDWAGGLVWALAPEDFDLRSRMAGIPGHATLVRASAAAHARWGTLHPEPAAVARLSEGLRARFDPRGVFGGSVMVAA